MWRVTSQMCKNCFLKISKIFVNLKPGPRPILRYVIVVVMRRGLSGSTLLPMMSYIFINSRISRPNVKHRVNNHHPKER